MEKNKIGDIIERISEINNKVRDRDGYEKISYLWDMGDILFKSGIKNIHPVAWEVQKKSYITRDLLSYAFRIRRKWDKKEYIKELFHSNKKYTLFREAFPLLENKKYAVSLEEQKHIIAIINSDDFTESKKMILNIKNKIIGIKNNRSSRLVEFKKQAEQFELFYADVSNRILNLDASINEMFPRDVLLKISQSLVAIVNNNYQPPNNIGVLSDNFTDTFLIYLSDLANSKKEEKARFLRLVKTDKVLLMADIFNSLYLGHKLDLIKYKFL